MRSRTAQIIKEQQAKLRADLADRIYSISERTADIYAQAMADWHASNYFAAAAGFHLAGDEDKANACRRIALEMAAQ